MAEPQTIFLSAYRNFSIRYILYSDILRTLKKKDRLKQELVLTLHSYTVLIPEKAIEKVIYETGIVKKGIQISLGVDD